MICRRWRTEWGYSSDERGFRERLKSNENYLIYFLPPHYIMQGLIADTGGAWKLYKQHHAISVIADWIFHPFRHLQEGHHAMHSTLNHPERQMNAGIARRLVFLKVINMQGDRPTDVFSINAVRTPVFHGRCGHTQSGNSFLRRAAPGCRMGNPADTDLLDLEET